MRLVASSVRFELIPFNASEEYLPNIKNVAIFIPPFLFTIQRYEIKYASMRVILQFSLMSFDIGAEDGGKPGFNTSRCHGIPLFYNITPIYYHIGREK
jgi:hypothetical protein